MPSGERFELKARPGHYLVHTGARGLHPRIADRFDLTLECFRRPYAGETSPLAAALARYAQFFHLFRDFPGYVEFLLPHDERLNRSSTVTSGPTAART